MRSNFHIEFDNAQEMVHFAALLTQITNQKIVIVPQSTPIQMPTASKKEAAPEVKAETPKAEKSKVAENPKPVAEKSSPLDPTYANMRSAILLVSRTKGRVAAETIMEKFGGKKENGEIAIGHHIPEANFAAIIAASNEALV